MRRLSYILLCLTFSVLPLSALAQTDTGSADTGTPQTDAVGQTTTAPSAGAAYQFQRQGIFDCNQNGSYAMSVGALSAIGGAYVPVADAAVELNTGTLVYKECILREVIVRERESAMSGYSKKFISSQLTGRNGNPQFFSGTKDILEASDRTFVDDFLQDDTLSVINPEYRSQVARSVAKNYYTNTRQANSVLVCPPVSTSASVWDRLSALENPACNSLGSFMLARDLANARIQACLQYLQDQWNWGNGYYPLTSDPSNPCRGDVVTPSITMQQSFQTILDSPVRQLESANDIGQMIGALYAGLTTQITSDSGGLAGILQSNGGQPSYLDRVVAESSAGARNAAANVALNILGPARQTEAAYFQAVNAIANLLTQTIGQLRTAENQCWALIIPKVCTSALSSTNTCNAAGGGTLKVATSTAFSQGIISSQIGALATTTVANVQASQRALSLINNLIAGVTNTNSLDAQRVSLEQLDALVAQHQLHTQPDLQQVSQQLADVQDSMSTLVEDTVQDWADGTPSGPAFSGTNQTGWCNTANQTTLDLWKAAWKQ